MKYKSKYLKKIIYIIYLVISTFLLSEIIFRLFDPFGVEYFFEYRRFIEHMQPDTDYFYIHTPGYIDTVQGADIKINSEGLRGPEIELSKGKKKRLLLLGDSIVFGWGVKQDSIFISRLQNLFEKANLDVIGAGVSSWNTRAEYEFLKKRGLKYDIDYLLLIIDPNDIELKGQAGEIENVSAIKKIFWKIIKTIASNSYTGATLLSIYNKYRYGQMICDLYSKKSEEWKDADKAMKGMIDLCRKNHIDLAAFIFGPKDSETVKTCINYYGKMLEINDIPLYYFPEQLYQSIYRNSFIDGHPNSDGHKIMANTIVDVVLKKQ